MAVILAKKEYPFKPQRLFENYLFYTISVLSEEFIPPVKVFFRLELEQTKQFSNSLSVNLKLMDVAIKIQDFRISQSIFIANLFVVDGLFDGQLHLFHV
jgi:hypothetical protein